MRNEEALKEKIADLKQTIYDLTWKGKFWGIIGGVLTLTRKKYRLEVQVNGLTHGLLSAMSSTYFSASGNANARAWDCWYYSPIRLFWFVYEMWCLKRALLLSNRFIALVKERGEEPSADQLDVAATIMRKACKWDPAKPGVWDCALQIIERGLGRNPDDNCRALLISGKAEINSLLGEKDVAESFFYQAFQIGVPKRTRVRLLRMRAEHYARFRDSGAALVDLLRAEKLAQEENLGDQLKKLNAIRRKYKL